MFCFVDGARSKIYLRYICLVVIVKFDFADLEIGYEIRVLSISCIHFLSLIAVSSPSSCTGVVIFTAILFDHSEHRLSLSLSSYHHNNQWNKHKNFCPMHRSPWKHPPPTTNSSVISTTLVESALSASNTLHLSQLSVNVCVNAPPIPVLGFV